MAITVPGVTLQNTLITGNLLLAEGIGDGDVTLKNVTVKGNTTIKGGGADSVYLEDCTLPNITISREGVRVVASGSTSVNIVTLESGATLIEVTLTGEGFEKVVISQVASANAAIILEGNFTAVEVNAKDAKIEIPSESQVETLTLNAATEVTGEGKIATANINANGVVIAQKPDTANVAKDVTSANVDGKEVGASKPSSGGGGGGGGATAPLVTTAKVTVNNVAYQVDITDGKKGTINLEELDLTAVLSSGEINVDKNCSLTLTVPANIFTSRGLDVSQELKTGSNVLNVIEYLGALYPDEGLTLAKIREVFEIGDSNSFVLEDA
ncbi:MAG: hypothetical protein RQM92_14605 [Candidatus Syntrophopropionicum ammoniitolerans]